LDIAPPCHRRGGCAVGPGDEIHGRAHLPEPNGPRGARRDRFGRRRIFTIGVAWFALASLLCAAAPAPSTLIGARGLQGIGAALLTPGSLATIEATFAPADRGRATGAWSGLSGVAGTIGPFLGGRLIQAGSWRLIFAINLPIAAILIARRHVRDPARPPAGSTCSAARW
jgi:MFS family permease